MNEKYALIHWVASNSTSIVPISAVIDKSLLKDSVKVGKVFAIIVNKKEPTGGWKKHDGRVLQTSDKLSVLRMQENKFLESDGSDSESDSEDGGRGHRKPKRKVFFGDDESEVMEVDEASSLKEKVKVVKQTKQDWAASLIEQVKKKKRSEESGCSNCAALKYRVRELERQNEALSSGLPGLVGDLKAIANSVLTHVHQTSTASITQGSTAKITASGVKTASTGNRNSTESESNSSTEYELMPGQGISMPTHVLKRCTHSDYKKLSRDLMCVLFTREEMERCSVMGMKGVGAHSVKDSRPALPQDKVQAIIYYVAKKFPDVEKPNIRQVMAYKLKDLRKSSTKTINGVEDV